MLFIVGFRRRMAAELNNDDDDGQDARTADQLKPQAQEACGLRT